VETARRALEDKAAQLSLSSRYKSEFLANMSHELRTPLNSLLILAKMLSDNKERNLSEKQVEYARTIHASGTDLLNLINEVLDLSKVEAGKIEIYAAEVPLASIEDYIERSFRPLAQQKGLEFTVVEEPELPESLNTDGQRLQQILRNLLANAFKFTERGSVTVRMGSVQNQQQFTNSVLLESSRVLALSVQDTGIGIPRDKHQLIFEAFQQADGTTSRKFGGTGLGLSISRELARLLGGEIHVDSAIGEGSTFTLFLPPNYREQPRLPLPEPSRSRISSIPPGANGTNGTADEDDGESDGVFTRNAFGSVSSSLDDESMENELNDDRDVVQPGDRVLLIIEDDDKFAGVLLEMARERGFRCIATLRGDIGLALVHRYRPDAILLDLGLPVVDGLTVLDRLKHNRETRHIPVHILSGTGKRQRGMRLGAFAYLEKPVTKDALDQAFDSISQFLDNEVRNLLIVDDDEALRRSIEELIGQGDVSTVSVGTAEKALELLRERHFDCMVLGLGLPDMSSFDLLEKIKSEEGLRDLPIIIYTDQELTPEEDTRLKKYAETIILKDVKSPERLLDETALFLHRVEANLPEEKRRVLEELHSSDSVFFGKKVMVVDDDVRNIFAITSVLEANGMNVVFAENGKDGIVLLEQNQEVSLILMDVMMPEMDGYETMRQIRKNPEHRALPIIALTAKAMKGDREKCIAAGASDYITKPVDPDQLISLMRVWMYR